MTNYICCHDCGSVNIDIIRYEGLYLIVVFRCQCGHQWQENIDLD